MITENQKSKYVSGINLLNILNIQLGVYIKMRVTLAKGIPVKIACKTCL